jgi:single-strand DNA-binding protein
MGSLNKVQLIGNVGHDPEINTAGTMAKLRIATTERWTDKNTGERKESSEWHSVVVFNEALIQVIDKYVTKGTSVYTEGSLKTRKYTGKDGNEKYATEIVLGQFGGVLQLLGRDDKEDRPQSRSTSRPAPRRTPEPDLEDDCPF